MPLDLSVIVPLMLDVNCSSAQTTKSGASHLCGALYISNNMKRQRSEQAAAPYRSKQRSAVSLRNKSTNGEDVENHQAQQPQQQQQKRNKNRGKPEHDEDDKLLHQATLAAAREAKAVKAFLLQKVSALLEHAFARYSVHVQAELYVLSTPTRFCLSSGCTQTQGC
jgi:hypothetical protein